MPREDKGELDPLELELLIGMGGPTWMLRTRHWSFGRSARC